MQRLFSSRNYSSGSRICSIGIGIDNASGSGGRRPPPNVRPPYGTMLIVLFISSSAVVYTHYSQVRDKRIMRAGVDRDKERLKLTREKNITRSIQQQQQQQQQNESAK